ncbi:hypothetical protein GLOTRDRAFT_70452 [Gloeophyllum trabeum ATCC 11539]|uniref:Uncharacterized protein n=1 Tax=Gloeophyllum trabeum (strain ATCC 11539 / FP-39264 / Madison 617) TaxID=670483 RepID=S7QIP2_GLOTA|nr:uncharacterized protein GLOTRDRAFT_70452 [Gloeophyllum trabeum ATCC 11539]EPQ59213.1 hypothetical protein GLOTRDRAFT_70452 [Gloeophyllum trabeum ATCC 11539]
MRGDAEGLERSDEGSYEGSRPTDASQTEAIGSRDLAQIRTLISIVFKWGIVPLVSRVSATWQIQPSRAGASIIDLTNTPQEYELLSSLLTRVLSMLFPNGVHASLSSSMVCAIILERHLIDALVCSLTLGWLPKTLSSESTPTVDSVRPPIMRLLSVLPPSRTIEALGSVLAFTPPLPRHVIKVCSSLLSQQLLRRDGVRALFMAIFTEEELSGESAPLVKLERVSRILRSIPAQIQPEDYFSNISDQIIRMFVPDGAPSPPPYIQASAFFLSQSLEQEAVPNYASAANTMLQILHRPFSGQTDFEGPRDTIGTTFMLTPRIALSVLVKIVSNIDPSPLVLTKILSPIISSLYAILECLESKKTSDPGLKEAVRNLLRTWGRVISATEGLETLWSIVSGDGGYWQVDLSGEIVRIERSNVLPSLSLLTTEDLKHLDDDHTSGVDTNIFGLHPDPPVFVAFIQSINRSDITSDMFVRLLDAYQESKSAEDADPMRTLLYLQLVNRMQLVVSSSAPTRMLSDHQRALAFVKHALEAASPFVNGKREIRKPRQPDSHGLTLEDLRIVPQEDEDDVGESDGPSETSMDEEMTVTAINLLLSLLEGNEDLSARTAPVLTEIFSLLESLVNSESDTTRRLASEARLVMTARLASTSADTQPRRRDQHETQEDPRETYQKALKLLQDPILPVRAHGLLLLRQLVSPPRDSSTGSGRPPVDKALVPAVLDIFLQAIRDEESYIFLNGVQGLSAMVDGFGKEVLRGLFKIYTHGLDGLSTGDLTQHDVDVRTRVGEALSQVIQRCGEALPSYADILIPPLFNVVRNASLPTAIRTSALSLLATCIKTSTLALLLYLEDLCSAMVDLLQLEGKAVVMPQVENEREPVDTMDTNPTSKQSKLPPFRRAALHLLSLLLKASTERIYDLGRDANIFPSTLVTRTRNTLRYISSTDEDAVVRVMAWETLDQLNSLGEAMIGI